MTSSNPLRKAMTSDPVWRKARRQSGLAHFERNSQRLTRENGRLKRAWRVPGTQEHGSHAMFTRRTEDIVREIKEQEHGGPLPVPFPDWLFSIRAMLADELGKPIASREDAARALGVSWLTWQMWESGKTMPSGEHLLQLEQMADRLGVRKRPLPQAPSPDPKEAGEHDAQTHDAGS